jgi:glycosyltransferase involved in cell wall biosynthesis
VSERPLVSVIIPTWQRHDLLVDCLANIREQSYPNVEVVVVSDGQDDWIEDFATEDIAEWYGQRHLRGAYPVRWYQCGRNWTGFLSESYCSAPVMAGQLLARGAYQCLWSDDERALDPDHLTKMVDLLESSGADFVYPVVDVYWKDDPERHRLIWADRPVCGSITHWLYRPSMIEKARGPYRTHVGRANDWDFIERALQGGATYAFLPEITFSHRIDTPP